ncbi:MAG: hypothetical protein PHI68_00990 [Candidatus Cloacimonetes bacterium]|nr:hypothetical protein [Candidatus Cloacimonadota bacterium]
MKKILLTALVLISLSLPMALSATDYDSVPPQSLPVFTGSLENPAVRVVYQKDGYLYVEHNGVVYVYKIK